MQSFSYISKFHFVLDVAILDSVVSTLFYLWPQDSVPLPNYHINIIQACQWD